jgi:hypothetical protein
MNKKLKASPKTADGSLSCQSALLMLSELLRQFGPPEEARRHFEAARIEILKGIRAMLDARIERRSKADRRGKKIAVE